jgi:hypothetical protein
MQRREQGERHNVPAAAEAPDPAEERKAAAEQARETAEHNAKLAEKLEATAQTVASIAERVAQQPQAAPAAAAPAPQRLSEEQVEQLIAAEKITRAQGMAYLLKLAREDARTEARREAQAALGEVGAQVGQQQVLAKIAEYKRAVPSLDRKGSPEWNEVAAVYRDLVAEGNPDALATELQALRLVHGRDPGKIGGDVRDRTKERATRGTETSAPAARTAAPRRRGSAENDPDLSSDHRTYVDHMIRIGQFKGWDDPKAVKYIDRAKEMSARKARRA